MTTLKLVLFMLATTALPIVGAIPTQSTLGQLGKGSAQIVLAACVLGLAWGLVKVVMFYRRDMLKHAEDNQRVMADNAVAMDAHAKSEDRLKEAIYHLASVIDGSSSATQAPDAKSRTQDIIGGAAS